MSNRRKEWIRYVVFPTDVSWVSNKKLYITQYNNKNYQCYIKNILLNIKNFFKNYTKYC